MIYAGHIAALATQHGKETVIAPALAAVTGLRLVVPPGIDTDALGTFTGEVPRPGTMRDAARMKARLGMKASGLPFGIASEGSFGPHPVMPFLALAREVMIFIDDMHGIEVVEEMASEATNFAALDLGPEADVDGFLRHIGFPRHAVVLRCRKAVIKGIDSRERLDRLLRLRRDPPREGPSLCRLRHADAAGAPRRQRLRAVRPRDPRTAPRWPHRGHPRRMPGLQSMTAPGATARLRSAANRG